MRVGDYVRTRDGIICKIVGGNKDNYDIDIPFKTIEDSEDFGENLLAYNDNGWYFNNKKYIIKSSPNIIDLIQEGDYVNGYKVDFVQNNEVIYNRNHPKLINLRAKDIETILTKEMFEQMEYRIGE